jgi:hypothetical protein
MADTERLHTEHPCQRCQAIDDAVPTEAQLKILATEDWDPKRLAFIPRAMTQEQAVAAELLTAAMGRFARAYGPEIAGARLSAMLDSLRDNVIAYRITQRTLAARADINARARKAWEAGDVRKARTIEDEPTPDYPGKDADDAWMEGR